VLPLPKKLPPTGNWTNEELGYFNLHYYQVYDWNKYFCEASGLTPMAKDIAEVDLGIGEIGESMYLSSDFEIVLIKIYRSSFSIAQNQFYQIRAL